MRGQQERTGTLFSYVSTEDRIPSSHPLRQVRRLAGLIESLAHSVLSWLSAWVEVGQIAPSQCPKAFLLQPISI